MELIICLSVGFGERVNLLSLFSHSIVSGSSRPHGLHHIRLPCPSLSPGICSNSCPLSWWCHSTVSSSVFPFSFRPQSFPAPESFPMSLLFALSGQSIGASASAIRWHRKLPSMVPECNWYTVRVFLRLPPHHQLRKGSDSSASRRSTQKAFKQLWDKAERDTRVYLIPQKPSQINRLIQGHYLVRHKLALTAKSKSYQGSPNSDKSIPTPPPPLWPTFLFLSFCFYPS